MAEAEYESKKSEDGICQAAKLWTKKMQGFKTRRFGAFDRFRTLLGLSRHRLWVTCG